MRTLIIIPLLLIFPCILPAQNSLRSNHSFTVNLIGVDYSYEQRLGGNFSIIARAGIENAQGIVLGPNLYGDDDICCINDRTKANDIGDFSYDMFPGISLEPRLYYNAGRRLRLGKRTDVNSADFVSIEARYLFGSGSEKLNYPVRISSMWGMRRVYGGRWLCEVNAGWNIYNDGDTHWAWGPRLNARFGIVF